MFKNTLFTLRGGLLALALAGCASFANADTSYHATIDTSSMSGEGWLDLTFLPGMEQAVGATATLSNFSGAFGSGLDLSGDASGALPGSFTLGNGQSWNEVVQALTLGGSFSFDVSFSGAYQNTAGTGTTLGVGLLTSDQGAYLGNPAGNLFEIYLTPLQSNSSSVFAADVATLAVAVAAVPEPSEYLLLIGGLCVLGAVSARRRRSTR